MALGNYRRMKSFVSALQKAVDSLPTEAEKQQLQEKCSVLVRFLDDLRATVRTVPTRDKLTEVRKALDGLQNLIDRTEESAALSQMLGLRRPQARRRTQTPMTQEENSRARSVLEHLESLPIDAMRAELEQESTHPVRLLQTIASLLGMRPSDKMSREALAHQVATRIANYRGDRILRGGTDAEQALKEKSKLPAEDR
jgi:hypothetical protein